MLESSFVLLQDVGVVQLNQQEEIHFSIDAYRGYRYASVRRHIRTDGFTGPTRDGITLTPDIVRALVPLLLAMPADEKQLKLGPVGKFAKRAGLCVVVNVVEFRGLRGLELRNWSQDKGFSKTGLWLPLTHWADIRKLFADTLAAIDEVPDVDF